jgi:hypothetical protein
MGIIQLKMTAKPISSRSATVFTWASACWPASERVPSGLIWATLTRWSAGSSANLPHAHVPSVVPSATIQVMPYAVPKSTSRPWIGPNTVLRRMPSPMHPVPAASVS